MSRKNVCSCDRSEKSNAFDAEAAFHNLSYRYNLLSEMLAEYVSQADLDRPTRNKNARELARRMERIVGGTRTDPGEFPECCLVGEKLPNGQLEWFCTGTLVHPQVIVTAAHCLDAPGNYHVALNTVDQFELDDSEVISAKRNIVHPDYRGGTHDIGLLILKDPSQVAPVEIASPEELNAAKKTRLVGFGNNDVHSSGGFGIQRKVKVPISVIRRCPDEDLDDLEDELHFESDSEFVAGSDGKDSCNGDSGGPAYITVENTRKLAGATSRAAGEPTLPCGEGGVYTRVDVYRDWIDEVMARFGLSFDDNEDCD